MVNIPKIENIHQKVYEAATRDGDSLDMRSWHRDQPDGYGTHACGTTHCRAGWVIHLAGTEGYALEGDVGPCLAAELIYAASSPIKVDREDFQGDMSNQESKRRMKRAMDEEIALNEQCKTDKEILTQKQ